jgi:radical S-adenosyl methionine domain-containing protein 2
MIPKKKKNQGLTSLTGVNIPSVNFHLWEPCNMRCNFCFATFKDVKQSILPKGHLPKEQALAVVRELAGMGFQKITFAGGEPTLCPWLLDLIETAKSLGMTTMIVTNGSRLTKDFLGKVRPYLDWIALSIDSLNEQTNLRSGRAIIAKTAYNETHYKDLVQSIIDYGFGFKINTVVHRYNYNEDFNSFIEWAKPDRWKVLQVLPMEGQNDEKIKDFEISEIEFNEFKNRHIRLNSQTQIVFEEVEDIRGTYVMVDPAGRFFENLDGKHRYSPPILEIGCPTAFQQMQYDVEGYLGRGGVYQWQRKPLPTRITLSGKAASGKNTVGKLLAEILGYEFVSLENRVRNEAGRLDLSISEFHSFCFSNPGNDEEIDRAFSLDFNKRNHLVIDYRLGFAFISEGFHVYLSIDDSLALDRLEKPACPGENAKTLIARNETFKKQFQEAYGLDYTNLKHYHLVIDCANDKSAQDIVNEILTVLK